MSIDVVVEAEKSMFKLQVDFSVPSQGVTAIFGPSGSGKTTLLRCLAGLQPCTGTVKIDNETWLDQSTCLPVHRRSLGYVFQEASLLPHITVAENIDYARKRRKHAVLKSVYDVIIEQLALPALLDRGVHELSGGERQRVAIARALVGSPKLLLMDEPVSGLDKDARLGVLGMVKRLCDQLGLSVLYVSHALDEVALICQRYVHLNNGRVDGSGAIENLFINPELPYAARVDALSLIECVCVGHDQRFCLSRFSSDGYDFFIPKLETAIGHRVKLLISAGDVSLSTEPLTKSSVLNCLSVRIMKIEKLEKHLAAVHLELGRQHIVAHISRRSIEALGLRNGMQVYANIKASVLQGYP